MNKPLTVPAYLEAKTKADLRGLMLRLQLRLKMKIVFYDFSFAQGMWTCWYEIPLIAERAEGLDG
jgi:hypothetical protein